MKTSYTGIYRFLVLNICSLLCSTVWINNLSAQTHFFDTTRNSNSKLFYTANTMHLIGLCADPIWQNFTPEANLHILKMNNLSETPMFIVSSEIGDRISGRIKHLFSNSNGSFGIYQEGPNEMMNYLQNRLAIGTYNPNLSNYLKENGDKLVVNGDIGCAGNLKMLGDSIGIRIYGAGPTGFECMSSKQFAQV